MVMAPARTGSDRRSSTAVSRTDHTNSGMSSSDSPSAFMLRMVVMKLADPKILLTPARWREKMPRSTAAPGCPSVDSGG